MDSCLMSEFSPPSLKTAVLWLHLAWGANTSCPICPEEERARKEGPSGLESELIVIQSRNFRVPGIKKEGGWAQALLSLADSSPLGKNIAR